MTDLDRIAHALEKPKITTLQLFNRPYKQHNFDIVRFDFADPTTAKAFLKFSRALARALGAGGWLQQLELGFQIWRRDVKVLPEALSSAATLRRLSFANSALGDERLQLLAQGICGCSPLQILDLSGCALTDASRVSLASILKEAVRRKADAEWQFSLRVSGRGKSKTKTSKLQFHRGLKALDLSFNFLSDTTSREICNALQLGSPLEGVHRLLLTL